MDVFIETAQFQRIAAAQGDAAKARNLAERLEQRIAELERRADRLALACQAQWEILRERTEITDQEIYARMEQIDLRDGQSDGRISGQVLTCTRCHRTINSQRTTCVYCGCKNPAPTVAY